MYNSEETEEVLYDFNIYFDSFVSNTIDLEGKVALVWSKGITKRI